MGLASDGDEFYQKRYIDHFKQKALFNYYLCYDEEILVQAAFRDYDKFGSDVEFRKNCLNIY